MWGIAGLLLKAKSDGLAVDNKIQSVVGNLGAKPLCFGQCKKPAQDLKSTFNGRWSDFQRYDATALSRCKSLPIRASLGNCATSGGQDGGFHHVYVGCGRCCGWF
jgi:hypothetical protein